jgi:hypothetical protein
MCGSQEVDGRYGGAWLLSDIVSSSLDMAARALAHSVLSRKSLTS